MHQAIAISITSGFDRQNAFGNHFRDVAHPLATICAMVSLPELYLLTYLGTSSEAFRGFAGSSKPMAQGVTDGRGDPHSTENRSQDSVDLLLGHHIRSNKIDSIGVPSSESNHAQCQRSIKLDKILVHCLRRL